MLRLKNKKILIAPYSPISRRLERHLKEKYQSTSQGFIDKNKQGQNIIAPNKIKEIDPDYIVIFSPNHHRAIGREYGKLVDKKKLIIVDFVDEEYQLLAPFSVMKRSLKEKMFNLRKMLGNLILLLSNKFIDTLRIERCYNLLIAEDYIDANIKYMYLYLIEKKEKAMLLTNNKQQLKELKIARLPAGKLFSLKGYLYTAIAKTIYLDHFIIDYLESTSNKQKIIQLWHGVGLKPIRDRSKINYDTFVSTSNWTNETNFKNVFQAKRFVNLGYPRNDILLKHKLGERDLVLTDKKIYVDILEAKRKNQKTILYMPTFRENGFESFPIKFKTLNQQLKENSIKLYVKLHPYVLQQYFDSIDSSISYSNIIFYKTQSDIYPALREIDILITDYSSIAYDFLLLDRPIVFFIYDFDDYISIREECIGSKFLFDFNDFTPGVKVKTEKELIDALASSEDSFKEHRKIIKNKFFDYLDSNSAKRISEYE